MHGMPSRPLLTLPLFSLFSFALLFSFSPFASAESPRGFFLEDLRRKPSVPAFYNLETRRLEPLPLSKPYVDFIDVAWDRERGRVFFSAHASRAEPFKIYMKEGPAGAERVVYENPAGPFRFLLSPDGDRLALQVMGPASWPFLAVYDWKTQKGTALGTGHSPQWSADGRKLLFLKIPGSLPTWLHEYSVETDTTTQLMDEPVMEAAYTDDTSQIILKTAGQSKRCDVFQLWNRRTRALKPFALEDPALCKKKTISQRELAAFPGHRFFFFKESIGSREPENQSLVVADVWGGRLQAIPYEDWNPLASAVEEMTLVISEDPVCVVPADGAGGKSTIPQARLLRAQ
jgi:hypothetical protein